METSRSVPQQTAQIFSPLAGQNLTGLRFSHIGQDTESPHTSRTVQQNTPPLRQNKTARRQVMGSNCNRPQSERAWARRVGGCDLPAGKLRACWASAGPAPPPPPHFPKRGKTIKIQ